MEESLWLHLSVALSGMILEAENTVKIFGSNGGWTSRREA